MQNAVPTRNEQFAPRVGQPMVKTDRVMVLIKCVKLHLCMNKYANIYKMRVVTLTDSKNRMKIGPTVSHEHDVLIIYIT